MKLCNNYSLSKVAYYSGINERTLRHWKKDKVTDQKRGRKLTSDDFELEFKKFLEKEIMLKHKLSTKRSLLKA